MKAAILIDFGSTFTKVVVVNMDEAEILLTARFPSTVKTNAAIGLKQCLEEAQKVLSKQDYEHAMKLASSSAAGGLRLAVVGISQTLSITAGRNTAFGAGAKIIKTVSGKLTIEDIEELERLKIEILLFCGGYENGNRSILYHNAHMLAESSLVCPIIYAGNSVVASEIRNILVTSFKECFLAENIIPGVGELHIEPTEEIIREVFLKRIVNMKGLDTVKDSLNEVVMPTPAAVLGAGELLARGTSENPGMGALLVVDIGGATTDIHSYIEQSVAEGAKIIGVKEPYAKRTVEGDLGMRESSHTLMEEVGEEFLAKKIGMEQQELEQCVVKRMEHTEFIANSQIEENVDYYLAKSAAYLSARRHAGVVEKVWEGGGMAVQRGKNLSDIQCVIGTGGPIVHSKYAREILLAVESVGECEREILLPRKVRCFLDKEYVLYAAGLLKEKDEEVALAIMKKSIVEI